MKKNLFYYLFAVICSVALFTACSDDDEDTTWQQIPEITNDNVTLKLNNTTLVGATATLDIINGENAKVTLINAIYGHASVPVNVIMEKKMILLIIFRAQQIWRLPEWKHRILL